MRKVHHLLFCLCRVVCAALPVIFLLISCNGKEHSPYAKEFYRIEHQIKENPLEAYGQLLTMKEDMEGKDDYTRMKYFLLLTKAADKSDLLQTSDTTMKAVSAYFEHHGTAEERMEAFYYTGSTYRDLGNSPKAIVWYEKASDFGERNIADIDTVVLTAVNAQLSGQLVGQLRYKEALAYLKRNYEIGHSLHSAEHSEDEKIRFYVIRELASHYQQMYVADRYAVQYRDSAAMLYNEAQALYNDDLIPQTLRPDFIGDLLRFSLDCDDEQAAQKHYSELCSYSEDKLPLNVLAIKGSYHDKYGSPDSALVFYSQYYERETSLLRRYSAARILFSLYDKKGESDKAIHFARRFLTLVDSASVEKISQATNAAYNNYVYYLDEEKQDENKRRKMILSFSVVTTFLFVLVCFLAYMLWHNRRIRVLSEMREELENELTLIRQSSELYKRLQVNSSDLYVYFTNTAKMKMQPEGAEKWEELYKAINNDYPTVEKVVSPLANELSEEEIKIIYLICLGLNKSQIAEVLGISRTTVGRLESRIEAIISQPIKNLRKKL